MSDRTLSASEVIASIPRQCFTKDVVRAWMALLVDLAQAALALWIIATVPRWDVGLVASVYLGGVLTGIFVIGHDAGHRAFSNKRWVNDLVGQLATSLALWPFHVWRLSHDVHHRYTHDIERDIAWVPFTGAKYRRLGPLARRVYLWTRTWLFPVGSMFFTVYFVKDALRGPKSRHFRPEDLPKLRGSIAVTALIGGLWALAAGSLGARGLVCGFVLPQLVFHGFLSTFTLFHHTHPDVRYKEHASWSFVDGQLCSTVNVRYPRIVDLLTHDISWHVPHHACPAIPHYRLREAHAALVRRFPDQVREARFGPHLALAVIRHCRFIETKAGAGLAWRAQD